MDKLYNIVGKIVQNGKTIGYEVEYDNKRMNISREQAICLVGANKVGNCTASIKNGTVELKGKGIDFDNLPCRVV